MAGSWPKVSVWVRSDQVEARVGKDKEVDKSDCSLSCYWKQLLEAAKGRILVKLPVYRDRNLIAQHAQKVTIWVAFYRVKIRFCSL